MTSKSTKAALAVVAVAILSACQLSSAKSILKAPSVDLQERVDSIRQLSIDSGLPQTQIYEDLCYDEGCLEAAEEIILSINASVDPCQDFFQFSCGRWIADNPIPPSSNGWSKPSLMFAKTNLINQITLGEPENASDPLPLNQAKQLFNMCMDVAAIERNGLDSLKQAINQIGGWQLLDPANWDGESFDWIQASTQTMMKAGQAPIVLTYSFVNLTDSDRQTVMIDQSTFGFLPRSVLVDRSNNLALFEAYETYIYRVAKELGSTQSEDALRAAAKDIIVFEEKLASLTRTDEERVNLTSKFNKYILQDFQDETDGHRENFTISWNRYLTELGVDDVRSEESISVAEPEYFRKLVPFLAEETSRDKATLANYIVWTFAAGLAEYTTETMRNITFDFQKQMSGGSELPPRNLTCSMLVTGIFGLPVSAKYVEKAFDDKYKDNVKVMVGDLKEAFVELVREADWMKEETKEKAIEKSAAMKTLMAYPDWISNKTKLEELYRDVQLKSEYLTSIISCTEFIANKNIKAVRLPSDKEPWDISPLTDINGFNFYYYNAIMFLVGILQPPYFGGNRPMHQNYGGIGGVIGHELTHGYDRQGSAFNNHGNLENWWDDETRKEFDERAKCIVEQYNNFCYDLGEHGIMCLNGEKGASENIADNGGLRQTYRAYKKYVERNGAELRLPGLEEYSTDQLFFIGHASAWCGSVTPEAIRKQILTGTHSLGEYRLKGPIKNSIDFANAFNCPVDRDGMNPPVEEKCVVW